MADEELAALAREAIAAGAVGMAKVDRDYIRKGGSMPLNVSEMIPVMVAFAKAVGRVR